MESVCQSCATFKKLTSYAAFLIGRHDVSLYRIRTYEKRETGVGPATSVRFAVSVVWYGLYVRLPYL